MDPQSNSQISYVFRTPRGKSTVANIPLTASYDTFLRSLLERAAHIDREFDDAQSVNYQMSRLTIGVHRKLVQEAGRLVRRRTDLNRYVENRACQNCDEHTREASYNRMGELDSESNYNCSSCITSFSNSSVNFSNLAYVVLNGKVLDRNEYGHLTQKFSESPSPETVYHISLRVRGIAGIDRQNRVGSKFGGGGVSSEQQSERERKERLRQLALETVDLAKDPYLMRNHLGTYECKLCLTLHTNEG